MWVQVQNGDVISEHKDLPRQWENTETRDVVEEVLNEQTGEVELVPTTKDMAILYPLREMASKGHTADLVALGWYQQNITQRPAATQNVTGWNHAVNGNQVDSTPILEDKPLAEREQIVAAMQAEAKAQVDHAAEATRMRYITPGAGMALVYEQKRLEAERLAAATAAGTKPISTDYPLMNERATRKGVTLPDVAAEWQAKATGWVAIATQIEALREGAKDAIDAVAPDAGAQDAINAIVAGITWPAP